MTNQAGRESSLRPDVLVVVAMGLTLAFWCALFALGVLLDSAALMRSSYGVAALVSCLGFFGLYRLGMGLAPFGSERTRASISWFGWMGTVFGVLGGGWLFLGMAVGNATGGTDMTLGWVALAGVFASLVGGVGLMRIARRATPK